MSDLQNLTQFEALKAIYRQHGIPFKVVPMERDVLPDGSAKLEGMVQLIVTGDITEQDPEVGYYFDQSGELALAHYGS